MQNPVAELEGKREIAWAARERQDEKQEIVCGGGKCYRGFTPENCGLQL